MVSCRECRKTLQGQYVKLKGDDFCKEDCAARYHGKKCWDCNKYVINHGLTT